MEGSGEVLERFNVIKTAFFLQSELSPRIATQLDRVHFPGGKGGKGDINETQKTI